VLHIYGSYRQIKTGLSLFWTTVYLYAHTSLLYFVERSATNLCEVVRLTKYTR